MQTNEENQVELTPEELDARKKDMLKFYNESMPYLEAQLSYEKRLMEIDEVRFKRFQISMQSAMMMDNQPTEEEIAAMEKESKSGPAPAKTDGNKGPKTKKPLRTA